MNELVRVQVNENQVHDERLGIQDWFKNHADKSAIHRQELLPYVKTK